MYQRNSDLVAIANRSNLTNSWWAGVVQTRRDALFVTPAYHALQLMSRHCGKWPLRVTDASGHDLWGADFGAPLDVAASLGEERRTLTVTVVNDGAEAREATLDLGAWVTSCRPGRCHVLAAESPEALNDVPQPRRVAPITRKLRVGPTVRRTFPPWSLTVLVVKR
jgi:alpha-L-arabinofuranosidase